MFYFSLYDGLYAIYSKYWIQNDDLLADRRSARGRSPAADYLRPPGGNTSSNSSSSSSRYHHHDNDDNTSVVSDTYNRGSPHQPAIRSSPLRADATEEERLQHRRERRREFHEREKEDERRLEEERERKRKEVEYERQMERERLAQIQREREAKDEFNDDNDDDGEGDSPRRAAESSIGVPSSKRKMEWADEQQGPAKTARGGAADGPHWTPSSYPAHTQRKLGVAGGGGLGLGEDARESADDIMQRQSQVESKRGNTSTSSSSTAETPMRVVPKRARKADTPAESNHLCHLCHCVLSYLMLAYCLCPSWLHTM
jgi:hypothetical protein